MQSDYAPLRLQARLVAVLRRDGVVVITGALPDGAADASARPLGAPPATRLLLLSPHAERRRGGRLLL